MVCPFFSFHQPFRTSFQSIYSYFFTFSVVLLISSVSRP
nr:MAG TPA: hypothetical protein [Caudoviricetes sp.]